MLVSDFERTPLGIGDEVVFISGPNTLNKGMITGVKVISSRLTVVEIAVSQGETTHTVTAAPFLCCRLS